MGATGNPNHHPTYSESDPMGLNGFTDGSDTDEQPFDAAFEAETEAILVRAQSKAIERITHAIGVLANCPDSPDNRKSLKGLYRALDACTEALIVEGDPDDEGGGSGAAD